MTSNNFLFLCINVITFKFYTKASIWMFIIHPQVLMGSPQKKIHRNAHKKYSQVNNHNGINSNLAYIECNKLNWQSNENIFIYFDATHTPIASLPIRSSSWSNTMSIEFMVRDRISSECETWSIKAKFHLSTIFAHKKIK